jgi:hypothetical protein
MTLARHSKVAAAAVLLGSAIAISSFAQWRDRYVDVGLWFDEVSYTASEAMAAQLGGPMTSGELDTIRSVARREVVHAFAPLRVIVSDNADATYHVRVRQEARIPGSRYPAPAGLSQSVPGVGGDGVLNFRVLVSNAIALMPPGATRADVIDGIGTGIGRAAVHELAHQLLGSTPVDDRSDRGSYEFASSYRAEQYYGEMHWGIAWPALSRRVGLR